MSIFLYMPPVSHSADLKSVNGITFTEREVDVIAIMINGKSAGTISIYLNIASKTVEAHIRNIMLKLGCNSRERIVNFIEHSGKFDSFRQHYLKILLEHEFLTELQKIKRTFGNKELKYQIVLKCNIDDQNSFLKSLDFHLKYCGLTSVTSKEANLDKNCKTITLISSQTAINIQDSENTINLDNLGDYYQVIFAILDKIISLPFLKNNIANFQAKYDLFKKGLLTKVLESDESKFISKYNPRSRRLRIIFICTLICTLILTFHLFKNSSKGHILPIRSDLIIPISTAFLERPEIIKRMNERLEGTEGIKAIALTGIVGIGGSGKTTMARYFARSVSDAPIVWELNAESKETLINSFRNLGYILAKSSELKKELDFIQQIQDPEIKEKILINFIKTCLKDKSEWILIYDNLESFSEINHLFPHNSDQWGKGKVIVTTRNEHITETSYIKPQNVIHIDQLNENEKLTLFCKILYNEDPTKLNQIDYSKTLTFLKKIPPFPLDVSVAGYSIKNTHVTFEQYLGHISEYSRGYEAMQVKLLKETTDYDKTRYGIISSTIEKLNELDSHFRDLFFFICLMDSQNIPYKLLENYNNAKIVEDLVYNLRQNGLLLRESYSDFAKENKVISLHRSTQEIGAAFLINSITVQEKEYLIGNVIRAMNNFYQFCIRNKDLNNIVLLIPHLNSLLNVVHNMDISQNLKNKYEIDIYLILSHINNKWVKNLTLTREYYKIILKKDNNSYLSPQVLATLLKDLGTSCLIMNLLEEGLEYCKKSMDLCKLLTNSELLLADNLQLLGNYYRKNNKFDKAKASLEEAINVISKVKSLEKINEVKAEIYSQLSDLYFMNYLNKQEGSIAEDYAIKALESAGGTEFYGLDRKPIPSHISCDTARRRWKYSEALIWHSIDYNKAYSNVLEADYIMKEKCPNNMHLKGRLLGSLSEIMLMKNNLQVAEIKATEAINILSIALRPSSAWLSNARRAEINIRLGKFNEGYKDCSTIFNIGLIERSNFHDLRYFTVMYNAAFAKYKLKDYQKSMKHFEDFFKNMDIFCKRFLDNETYTELKINGAFAILLYDGEVEEIIIIKTYLQHSIDIFTAIFGKDHPFVKDYVIRNGSI